MLEQIEFNPGPVVQMPSDDGPDGWSKWLLGSSLTRQLNQGNLQSPADMAILAALSFVLSDHDHVPDLMNDAIDNDERANHSPVEGRNAQEHPPVNYPRLLEQIERHLQKHLFVGFGCRFESEVLLREGQHTSVWRIVDANQAEVCRSQAVFETQIASQPGSTEGDTDLSVLWSRHPESVSSCWLGKDLSVHDVLQNIYSATSGALLTLTEREARVLKLRFGLEDGFGAILEDVGRQFGVTRERIRQIETKGIRKLRHPDRARRLATGLDVLYELSESTGYQLSHPDFLRFVCRSVNANEHLDYHLDRHLDRYLLLLKAVFGERSNDADRDLSNFDKVLILEMAKSPTSIDLEAMVSSIREDKELGLVLDTWPKLDIRMRVHGMLGRTIGGSETDWPNIEELSETGIMTSQDIKLSGIIRTLRGIGYPVHCDPLTDLVNESLPSGYEFSNRNLHAWLGRFDPTEFNWIGNKTFALKEWDLGHSEATGTDRPTRGRRRGVGDEMVTLLVESGRPLSLPEIRDYILARFQVTDNAILASITQDLAKRFVELPGSMVGLSGRDGGIGAGRAREAIVRISSQEKTRIAENASEITLKIRRFLNNKPDDASSNLVIEYLNIAKLLGLTQEFQSLLESTSWDEETQVLKDTIEGLL